MVTPDRARRARHRPQRGATTSPPDDASGAALPARCLTRTRRACGRATLERSRATGENACARCVSRLRSRRASVGTDRAGALARSEIGRGRPREDRRPVRAEGEPTASCRKQTSSLRPRVPRGRRSSRSPSGQLETDGACCSASGRSADEQGPLLTQGMEGPSLGGPPLRTRRMSDLEFVKPR